MSILNVGRLNSSSSVKLPSYNNSNLPIGEVGMIIYNSEEEAVQVYNGTEWLNIGSTSFSATGGTILSPGNGYTYHVFTSPGDFVTTGDGVFDILVVGGGGGGGAYYGGGGGAGGVAKATNMPLPSGSYPVSIGPGGPISGTGPVKGNNGTPTTFGTSGQTGYILARGGGAGGGHYTTTPAALGNPGGSGGGSSGADPAPADGAATQPGTNPSPFVTDYGNPGGNSTPTGGYAPAGGGGAGGAGVSINSNIPGGGNGGDGIAISGFEYSLVGLTPLIPTANSPSNNHYGGGGGAALYSTGVAPDRLGLGGAGGGGSGTSSPRGQTAGLDGLGGGGGGRHPSAGQGSAGGKGIVIVRYLA